MGTVGWAVGLGGNFGGLGRRLGRAIEVKHRNHSSGGGCILRHQVYNPLFVKYSTIDRHLPFNDANFMRRDSIFYALFQRSPALLFELLENQPQNAQQYRFESVAVKEPKFEIDGIFLPPDSQAPRVIYACEVQFQRDEQLYERMFGELFLYFYRNRQYYSNWQAVIIYPSRQQEQVDIQPYRMLIESDHVHRIYLKELGAIDQLPLGMALMVLTTKTQKQAPAAARKILARSQAADLPQAQRQVIIDMIGTIISYQFNTLSREEIDQMLGITLKETRVYQEAREEERQTIALNLLKQGISMEVIGQATGLTIEQLQHLQAQIGQNE